MELDFSGIIPAIPGLWNGMVMTLQLMVMGVVGGIALGTVLALMRLSSNKLLSRVAGCSHCFYHCRERVPHSALRNHSGGCGDCWPMGCKSCNGLGYVYPVERRRGALLHGLRVDRLRCVQDQENRHP